MNRVIEMIAVRLTNPAMTLLLRRRRNLRRRCARGAPHLRQAIPALVNHFELCRTQHCIHVASHSLALVALILAATDDKNSMAALFAQQLFQHGGAAYNASTSIEVL